MPPKGGNAKKEGGRAKKAENEAAKKDTASKAQESKEASEWADGSKAPKASQADKEERRKAELARKAENARLLAEEESAAPAKVKAAPKAGANKGKGKDSKKDVKPAGPGAIAAGGATSGESGEGMEAFEKEIESYSATGLDNAIDLMEVVTAKTDKASVGQAAAGLEKHPERRFKGAFEAYKEAQLPILKDDYPGLRLNQYQDMMYKNFQKSPDNPFNQTVLAYDATKEEKLEALKAKKAQVEERLREKS